MRKLHKAAPFLALALLAAAWLAGKSRHTPDWSAQTLALFPGAGSVEESGGLFSVFGHAEGEKVLKGFAALGRYQGYGGPLTVLAGLDTAGKVSGIVIVEHRETPAFFKLVQPEMIFKAFLGKPYKEVLARESGVSGITGATKSVRAIEEGARSAVAAIAAARYDEPVKKPREPFKFGILELTIILLFLNGILLHGRMERPAAKRLRWTGQAAALLIIGFWHNTPVNLARTASFLMGYFPPVRTGLALYLLFGGFVLSIIIFGKNIHCFFVCPFGAAQRFIGLVWNRKWALPGRVERAIIWFRRLLVLSLVAVALATDNPGLANYEPFGVLFALQGSYLQWGLLFLVVVLSLFLRNPWCRYLCPMQVAARVLNAARRSRWSFSGAVSRLVTRPLQNRE